MPIAADKGATYGSDPVSSGPYMITSVDPATGVVLDRNPRWDPATDDVRTALPDRVVVRLGMSGLERDQALLAGSADVDISGTGIQPQTTARLSDEDGDDAALQDRLDDVTTGAVRLLAMPTDVAPMDVPACRQAVALVVDRAAVQDRLGGAGNAVRASQLWPRGLEGGPDEPDPRPDLDAARAALEECGQPDGFRTVLAVAGRAQQRRRGRTAWPTSWPRWASRCEIQTFDSRVVLLDRRGPPGQRDGQRASAWC